MLPTYAPATVSSALQHEPAFTAIGSAAGQLVASSWAVVGALFVAAVPFSLKYGLEVAKFLRDDRRYNAERAKAPGRALVAVSTGLQEFDRHQNQNWLVLKTIEQGMLANACLPMEHHIWKLSVRPLPAWTTDTVISELSVSNQLAIGKLIRMVPNFQFEYEQALLLIGKQDLSAFTVLLPTLIVKARVGMEKSREVYKAIFSSDLPRLEPNLASPIDGEMPTLFSKPIDYYPRP